jgi:hypothetical protein
MKKLILSCAVALTAAVSFTSCAKETCYVCEIPVTTLTSSGGTLTGSGGTLTGSGGATVTTTSTEVCGDKATTTTAAGVSSGSVDIPGGVSAADYRISLEAAGYTCNDK